jgi:outer membrane cobalamin receptor
LLLQARLDNLSDETYESASFYPQPGREWHVGIRYAAR